VDETSAHVKRKTQQPHDYQNDENGPNHVSPPVISVSKPILDGIKIFGELLKVNVQHYLQSGSSSERDWTCQ
jgi:hypothetical protein